MIFTVHEQEQTLLQYVYFQNLMRNDREMTQNEWENKIHDH